MLKLRLKSECLRSGSTVVAFAQMPPAPPPCAKCKSTSPALGDTWCTGCSAWEFLGRELSGSWDSSGARILANDLVVATARQVRALRSLSAGLVRDTEHSRPAGENRAVRVESSPNTIDTRETLPRRRSAEGAPPPPVAKEEDEDTLEEQVESEEEEEATPPPSPTLRPISGGSRRPPEPEGPPPKRHREEHSSRGSGRREPERRDSERHHKSDHKRTRRSGHRGGRRHQRLYRAAQDPNIPLHRKPGAAFWELQSGSVDALELGHLGR